MLFNSIAIGITLSSLYDVVSAGTPVKFVAPRNVNWATLPAVLKCPSDLTGKSVTVTRGQLVDNLIHSQQAKMSTVEGILGWYSESLQALLAALSQD